MDVPGADLPHVVAEEAVLLNGTATGKRIVVVGGAFWDVETALHLAGPGKEVTLIREEPTVSMAGLGPIRAFPILFGMLQEKQVSPIFSTKVVEIEKAGVKVSDSEGNTRRIEADTVVLSMGRVADRRLAVELRGIVPELHEVGDCVKPRCVADAVYEGRLVGSRI